MQFMKMKRSENLDSKKLLGIDKIWNVRNPEVKNLKSRVEVIKIKSFLTNIDIFHLKNYALNVTVFMEKFTFSCFFLNSVFGHNFIIITVF